jgi:protein-S-isoprenylcysteine O-methyltransferase Ste14
LRLARRVECGDLFTQKVHGSPTSIRGTSPSSNFTTLIPVSRRERPTTLGLRFSNLTNRGIITQGPYRFVRHPAYAAKVVAWWCDAVPVFGSILLLLFFSGWIGVYFLRALTEERHLKADPCYLAYCAAVKHRFVPGIW